MELIAPLNDSDNRSEAVSVGKGGRVSSAGTGGAVGDGLGGATVWGACAFTGFFVGVGTGFGLGAVVGMAGNEIRATSIDRKGCSLSE
jgi:hypothetical protein